MQSEYRIGIDPGTSSSPTSIAVVYFDVPTNTKTNEKDEVFATYTILGTYSIQPVLFIDRMVSNVLIAESIGRIIEYFTQIASKERAMIRVALECPFLKGAAHDYMNQLLTFIKYFGTIDVMVNPKTVKKFMGSGSMEKEDMAKALLEKPFDRKSINLINRLIVESKYDETDAICVALYE